MSNTKFGPYNVRPVAVGMLPRGHQWTVKDLGETMAGYADIIGRELGVSRNADKPYTRFVQLHEQAHVMWSKYHLKRIAKAAGLDMDDPRSESYVQAAEDARVNSRLRRAVPDSGEGFVLPDDAPLRYDVQGYMASYRTSDAVRAMIRARLEAEGKGKQCDLIDAECARIEAAGKLTASSMTVPLSKLMRTLVEGEAEKEPDEGADGDGPPNAGSGDDDSEGVRTSDSEKGDSDTDLDDDGESAPSKGSSDDEDSEDERDEEDEDESSDSDDEEEQDDEEEKPEIEETGSSEEEQAEDKEDEELFGQSKNGWNDKPILEMPEGDDTRWNMPKIATPALTVTVQRPGTHNHASSDSGVQLRDITRYATDGMVFSRSRQRPGTIRRGTFLLDASGSMALTVRDVEEIVNAVPSATVALYSGKARGESFITIVAKDGKRCNLNEVEYLRGNTCDGPGLLWLSRQMFPRFWYCDGLVTNRVEQINETIIAECEALKVAGRIIHIDPTPEQAAGAYARRVNGIRKRKAEKAYPFKARETHGEYIVRVMRELHLVK